MLLMNTPPLDWFGFLGIFSEKLEKMGSDVDFSDYPTMAYERKLEIISFAENVFVYFGLALVFGYAFRFLTDIEFIRLMLILWVLAYGIGITTDVLLIHGGYYLPAYKRFKGTDIKKIFKLFVFIIYHSAIYLTLGSYLGRFII